MTTLRDIANLPKRRYRTVNDLSESLISIVGLPSRYQKRIDRAERLIHLCNPIARAYYSLSVSYHRVMHTGIYRKCDKPECSQSRALLNAWGVDRKAHQSGKDRRSSSQ